MSAVDVGFEESSVGVALHKRLDAPLCRLEALSVRTADVDRSLLTSAALQIYLHTVFITSVTSVVSQQHAHATLWAVLDPVDRIRKTFYSPSLSVLTTELYKIEFSGFNGHFPGNNSNSNNQIFIAPYASYRGAGK